MRTGNNKFACVVSAIKNFLKIVEARIDNQVIIIYLVERIKGSQEDTSDLNSRGKFLINAVHLKALFIE
jgi:hypothetical protein